MSKKYKYGLVLSGGGTRGFAHLGVIAAMQEMGINPDVISGASAGAIVGAFIAAGKSPKDVFELFKSGSFSQYTKIQFPTDGLLKLPGVKDIIDSEIKTKLIEDLPVPFYVCVSNLNMGKVEYLNKGILSDTVLASSAIPVLFSPVKMGKYLYVDGGLMDNIPVSPLEDICENIIVSNICPITPRTNLNNIAQIAMRSFYMGVNAKTDEARKSASYYIEPEGIDSFEIIKLKHSGELYDIGYKTAKKVFSDSEIL